MPSCARRRRRRRMRRRRRRESEVAEEDEEEGDEAKDTPSVFGPSHFLLRPPCCRSLFVE